MFLKQIFAREATVSLFSFSLTNKPCIPFASNTVNNVNYRGEPRLFFSCVFVNFKEGLLL